MKNIVIFVFVLVLISCKNSCKKEAKIYVDNIPAEGISLNTWQIVGPFQTESKDYYLSVDNLKQFGSDENTISYDDFVSIQPKNTSPKLKNLFVASDILTDFNQLYNINPDASINGNVYCMCILKSDRDKKLKLNFSSKDGAKVWVNHNLVHYVDVIEALDNYKYYLDINLKKGVNTLLIKVNNLEGKGWKLFASLENENEEGLVKFKKTFSCLFGLDYLKRSVITKDTLQLNEALPKGKYFISIVNLSKTILLNDTITDFINKPIIVASLKDGLYKTILYTLNDTFTQPFYKGDIEDTIHKIIDKIDNYKIEYPTKQNIQALCFRFKHLQKSANMGRFVSNKREWDKKMLYIFKQLNYYHNLLSKHISGKHSSGDFLKSYISKIDNNLQYYQVHVPESYKKEKPLPLFIEIPPQIGRYPSYLETMRVADIALFESLSRMSNKYNMIVLQPHNRTLAINSNTISEADLWEVIDDLKKDYNIDTTRIYMTSECVTCVDLLRFAVKHPDMFAAIVTVAMPLSKSSVDNAWVQHNDPTNYFKNIINLPFLNFHSKYNPHTPIKFSDDLNIWVNQAKLKNFEYRRTSELNVTEGDECREETFQFCSKYKVNVSPAEVFFKTSQTKYNKSYWITLNEIVAAENATIEAKISNNTLSIKKQNIVSYTIDLATLPFNKDKPLKVVEDGKVVYEAFPQTKVLTFNPLPKNQLIKNSKIEGPFANVFTNSFIVVPGTNGKKAENEKIKAMADTLNRYWKLRYFDGLRIKPDKDITKKDIAESNLILLGGTTSNLVFEKIKGMLPVAASNTAITIGGRLVKGDNLGYYVIYPNPLNPKKYVAIISYNNTNYISLGFENFGSYNFDDVSNYGWFDYKVWDAKNPSNSVMEGYFDSRWHLN